MLQFYVATVVFECIFKDSYVSNVKKALTNFKTNLHRLKCASICKETLIHKVSIHNAIQMFLYINVCNSTQIFESLMRGV